MPGPYHESPDQLPEGIIPRVEPQPKHREFIQTVQPPAVMLKITHARQLVDRGETATSYFGPIPSVITTSTVKDPDLFMLRWRDEYEILEQFEPDFHIPADQSVYEQQDPDERLDRVTRCLEGFLAIRELLQEHHDAFSGSPPTLIPLVKGTTAAERRKCLHVFETEGVRLAAFYAVQYYTGGNPAIQQELVDVLNQLDRLAQPDLEYLVIGGLGKTLVERFPDSIAAAAGWHRWYSRMASFFEPGDDGPYLPLDHAHLAYDEVATQVNDALNASPPVSFRPEWHELETSFDRSRPSTATKKRHD